MTLKFARLPFALLALTLLGGPALADPQESPQASSGRKLAAAVGERDRNEPGSSLQSQAGRDLFDGLDLRKATTAPPAGDRTGPSLAPPPLSQMDSKLSRAASIVEGMAKNHGFGSAAQALAFLLAAIRQWSGPAQISPVNFRDLSERPHPDLPD